MATRATQLRARNRMKTLAERLDVMRDKHKELERRVERAEARENCRRHKSWHHWLGGAKEATFREDGSVRHIFASRTCSRCGKTQEDIFYNDRKGREAMKLFLAGE